MRLLRIAAAVPACLFLACPPRTLPDEPEPPVPVLTAEQAALATEDGAPLAPLTASRLLPVVGTRGAPGVTPEAIVVSFATDVVGDSAVGAITENTELVLSPPIEGRLAWKTTDSLEFVPAAPLTPGARYRVELRSVGTRSGVVTPATPALWTYEFAVPPFALRSVALASASIAEHQARVAVSFSAPVSPAAVRSRLAVDLDGRRLTPSVERGDQPHVVRITIQDAALKHQSRLRVALDAGISPAATADVALSASVHDLLVQGEDVVVVVAVRRQEGASGHYVEVVCDDGAVEGWHDWWYDNLTSDWHELSRRCVPDLQSAQDHIRFEPPLPFSVAPSQHGFRIMADFERGTYGLQIDAGLRSEDGGALLAPWSGGVTVPAREPQVAFAGKGRYLPRRALTGLAVRHLNADSVQVEVRHVPERNLVFWVAGDSERADQRTSDRIADVTLPVESPPDAFATSWLDLADLIPRDVSGVFELTASHGGSQDVSRLLVTDLELVAKADAPRPDEPYTRSIRAWVLGVEDHGPQRSALVRALAASGKELGRCTTGPEGGCLIALTPDPLDPSPPILLLASRGDDVTYLAFDELRTEIAEAAVRGRPFTDSTPYTAALWADRGVFRPGDTAHLVAVVRAEGGAAPPAGLPVEATLRDPRGNPVRQSVLPTNVAGLVSWDVPFADFATTGAWSARLTVGEQRVGDLTLHVEEFVPERMEVRASAEPVVVAGRPVPVAVSARYLFGGSAGGSQVELSCELQPAPWKPARNGSFTYGLWHDPEASTRTLDLGAATGELGPDGATTLSCPGLGDTTFLDVGRVLARATVFEAGSGRSSQQTTAATLLPGPHVVGLDSGAKDVGDGDAFTVSGVVVDAGGGLVPSATEVEIELVRLVAEYGWSWDPDTGSERFRRYLRRIPEGSATVPVQGGRFTAPLAATADVEAWLVRASYGGATTELRIEGSGSRYWWWGGEGDVDETPRPLKPGDLALQLPERVDVGERATARFVAPYAGRALWTVETDRVIATHWMDVVAGPVEWTFAAPTFTPNVYVSALLLKDPHLDSEDAFTPGRSFGVGSVPVRPTAHERTVAIDAPAEVQPNSPLSISVRTEPSDGPVFVTVAAVDEGILQLTDFADPDPLAQLFERRALGVESFETVGWTLLLPPQGTSRSIGGDAGESMGRVQMVKPVALWSGVVEARNGVAAVELDVPSYRGALRVMAVAADATRVGAASSKVLVREPIVLQATLPRFVTGGDTFVVPVFLTNTTATTRDVTVTLSAAELPLPGVAPLGKGTPITVGPPQRLRLAPGEQGLVRFDAEARWQVGAARFDVLAQAGDLTSRDTLEVPLLPAGPRDRLVQRIPLRAGATDVGALLGDWVPTTEQTTLFVTASPWGDAFAHLGWLIRYPYGCIEQTTSSTRPLLFVRRLLDALDPEAAAGGVDAWVRHGIDRVLSMQTAEGGFSYWPGGSSPDAWGTAYALHMLLDAAAAGFDVPATAMASATTWLARQVDEDRGGRAIAYQHYVLARAGEPRKARAGDLLAQLPPGADGGAAEARTLLEAALWLAGDRRHEPALLAAAAREFEDVRGNWWNYGSERRRRALTLDVLVDLLGDDPRLRELGDRVALGLRQKGPGSWTTQEVAWSVSALGKLSSAKAGAFPEPTLLADGEALTPSGGSGAERGWAVARASERGSLTLNMGSVGDGAWLVLRSAGVREGVPPRVGGEGLAVTRTWQRADGTPLGLSPVVDLGELIYAAVSVTNKTDDAVRNLALVDRVPAGWEIENPRLGRDSSPSWFDPDDAWSVEHLNLRDDRVELFGTLPRKATATYVYALRAVTAGEFAIPPVEAEAMYDPDVWARQLGGRATVVPPWPATAGQ